MWQGFAITWAASVLVHGQASVMPLCPETSLFKRWLTEFERVCLPGVTLNKTTSCSWVTCPCLEVSHQVPVSLNTVATCYEHGAVESHFNNGQRRVAAELLRGTACGKRSQELGKPCGICDRHAGERSECLNNTQGPLRVFVSAAMSWHGWGVVSSCVTALCISICMHIVSL